MGSRRFWDGLSRAPNGAPATTPVVVLGYGFWQAQFGGDAGVLGRELRLNGVLRTVVGVMPRRFVWRAAEIYVPVVFKRGKGEEEVRLFGRLKPGVTRAHAESDLRSIIAELEKKDFANGWLRLEPGETKNGDGRMFPLTPWLRAVLERERRRTEALERGMGQIIPWVFHRDGEGIRYFRRRWLAACKAAGFARPIRRKDGRLVWLPTRIPHDFRHGCEKPRASGRPAICGDGHGWPQNRGDLSPVRDRRREDAARGSGASRGVHRARARAARKGFGASVGAEGT